MSKVLINLCDIHKFSKCESVALRLQEEQPPKWQPLRIFCTFQVEFTGVCHSDVHLAKDGFGICDFPLSIIPGDIIYRLQLVITPGRRINTSDDME